MLFEFRFQSLFSDVNDPPQDGETFVEADDIMDAIEVFREQLGPSNYFRIQEIITRYEHRVLRRIQEVVDE